MSALEFLLGETVVAVADALVEGSEDMEGRGRVGFRAGGEVMGKPPFELTGRFCRAAGRFPLTGYDKDLTICSPDVLEGH